MYRQYRKLMAEEVDVYIEEADENVLVEVDEAAEEIIVEISVPSDRGEIRTDYQVTVIDDEEKRYSYTGKAVKGSDENASVWTITRIEHFLAGGVDVKVKYGVKWTEHLIINFD